MNRMNLLYDPDPFPTHLPSSIVEFDFRLQLRYASLLEKRKGISMMAKKICPPPTLGAGDRGHGFQIRRVQQIPEIRKSGDTSPIFHENFFVPQLRRTCHDQHSQVFPNYCINDLDNDNFRVLGNSMNIAELCTLCPNSCTPIYRQFHNPQKRKAQIFILGLRGLGIEGEVFGLI